MVIDVPCAMSAIQSELYRHLSGLAPQDSDVDADMDGDMDGGCETLFEEVFGPASVLASPNVDASVGHGLSVLTRLSQVSSHPCLALSRQDSRYSQWAADTHASGTRVAPANQTFEKQNPNKHLFRDISINTIFYFSNFLTPTSPFFLF